MQTPDDNNLLKEYATSQSESAFAAVVTRHINMVYSAALRQVESPDAAQEVTQAVFIVLARKSGSLRPGTVLTGWLFHTTRYVALAHRRALARRRRLENEAQMECTTTAPNQEAAWQEIAPFLDEALATLSEADRQAILLRYFEGKSLSEVGTALAVSEEAARKRVSRGLEKLRKYLTKQNVVFPSAVLAVALAANSVQAAPAGLVASVSAAVEKGATATVGLGLGSKLATVFGKSILLSWMIPLVMLVSTLPSLILVSVFGKMERKNFRDTEGFRPQLHERFFASFLWGFPLVLVAMFLAVFAFSAALGKNGPQYFLVCLIFPLLLISGRSLVICRNRFLLANFGYIVMIGICALLRIFWGFQSIAATILWFAAPGLLILFFKDRPIRMDYSLLLRAAHGMLEVPEESKSSPPDTILTRSDLFGFARFLGARYLVINYSLDGEGLRLRLLAVSNSFFDNMIGIFMPPITEGCSQLLLRWNGTVEARCGRKDAANLAVLKLSEFSDVPDLEREVARAVRRAWQEYRNGNETAAESALGQVQDSDIFSVPLGRAKSTRVMQIGFAVLLLLGIVTATLPYWAPPWFNDLRSIHVTQSEVRAFLEKEALTQYHGQDGLSYGLLNCATLPPTNLFTTNSLNVWEKRWRQHAYTPPNKRLVIRFSGAPLPRVGLAGPICASAPTRCAQHSTRNSSKGFLQLRTLS